jgi:hypothetical protein
LHRTSNDERRRVKSSPYRKASTFALAVASIVIPTHAFGTPNVESCRRSDEYTRRTHQLIQDAQKAPFELLILMYTSMIQPQEIAIGLVRRKDEYHLVRFEFRPSLFYGSYKQVGPREEGADFTKTHVHVDTRSVPISGGLARTMASKLDRLEAQTKEPNRIVLEDGTELEQITTDGYTHELTLADGRCVAVDTPPQDTTAFNFVRFNRFLASELTSWRPRTREAFEAQALRLLNDVDPNE